MHGYRHIYHAGNFADVFKHIILVYLIKALSKKDKGFLVLDTHAGCGIYDLLSEQAQKTKEYQEGILKIWLQKTNISQGVQEYFNILQNANPEVLRFYLGSAAIAEKLLRKQDRLLAVEYNPNDYKKLSEYIKHYKVLQQDGYQALQTYLPPLEKRGLVFIDPPYDYPEEFQKVLQVIKKAYKRWETGVYAIWYPIVEEKVVERFKIGLQNSHIKKILSVEMTIYNTDIGRMYGCGMIIINPPWQLDENIQQVLPWLWKYLHQDVQSYYRCEWLVGEA